jgi:precorrin-3B methylase
MSLSDNLKPWSIIEKRLDLAAQADLVLAFYNPISRPGRTSWGGAGGGAPAPRREHACSPWP